MEGDDNGHRHDKSTATADSAEGLGFGAMTIRRRKNRLRPPAAFLVKTFKVVEDPATDEVISWNARGTAFVVWQPAEFARDLLPTLFKHSNFSSFVRQLNTYGFRKVTTGRWEFFNDMFRKGSRELLCHIRRRKPCAAAAGSRQNLSTAAAAAGSRQNQSAAAVATSQRVDEEDQRSSSSSSSSSGGGHVAHVVRSQLADENMRLKEENGVLSSELSLMKKKCRELLDVVAACTVDDSHKMVKEEEEHDSDDDGDDDEMKGPKLFGVTLEVRAGGERPPRRKRKQKTDLASRSLLGVLLSQFANN